MKSVVRLVWLSMCRSREKELKSVKDGAELQRGAERRCHVETLEDSWRVSVIQEPWRKQLPQQMTVP